MSRITRLLTTVAVALAAVTTAAPAARAAGPAVGEQLITVTAANHSTSYAMFGAWRWSGTAWVRVLGPWVARVGYNGIAWPGQKREGDGKTPAGTYGFGPFMFGVSPNPGVAYPWRHAWWFDVWDDDPASRLYNEWVNEKYAYPGRNPEPMHNVPAYDYGAVIAYNTARVPGLGSAIFLHVGTGGPTAGCVSLPASRLLKVLHWLNPSHSPLIRIRA